MSYNIDSWRTKELVDLRLPLALLLRKYEVETNHREGKTYVDICESGGPIGHIDGDWFVVEKLELYGEGSGWGMDYLENEVFPHSRGTLHAALVWEGGDSITRLRVHEGSVEHDEIEL